MLQFNLTDTQSDMDLGLIQHKQGSNQKRATQCAIKL